MNAARRPLGGVALTALVVGNMIGSGVFLLPAALAPYGAASALGWAVTLAGSLALATVYAWLARAVPDHGGAYGYARRAFGDGAGFTVAWSYWVCTWSANAAIAVAFAGSLGALWPAATATPLHGAASALGALWLCTAINLAGVREAARVQLVTTLLKLVPLLLFGVLGLAAVHADAYRPFNPAGRPLAGVASAAAALTLWAMLGFEAATVPVGVVRDPQRTVPRATIAGMLIAGVATMLACTAVIGLAPRAMLAQSAAPMVEAAARTWGAPAGIALAVVAAVSCFGALNGWVLLQAQTPLPAARDGLFPRRFGVLDRRGTPAFGLATGSLLASVLIAANYSRSLVSLFTFSILLSTATTLLPYLASVLAWWRIGRIGPARGAVAALALAYALWALVGTGGEALAWGAVLVAAGWPVYAWRRRPAGR